MRASRHESSIAALASGWSQSARAIIRLSGTGVRSLASTVLEREIEHAGRVVPVRFRLGNTASLPCLAIRSDAPHSFTGEDSLELIVPGNPILLERILARLCSTPGVREAQPGEFSARAYLNGKLSLDQAEGIAAVIGAQTDDQLAAARSLLAGSTGSRYHEWANEATTLLALVEAGIDFTDQEDVVPIPPAQLAQRIERLRIQIGAALGADAGAERVSALPRIVLVGPPNAGKSTLFNALLGRERTIVSPIAGTTRDAIAEEIDLARPPHDVPCGPRIVLVDLAGLDRVPRLSEPGVEGIERSAQQRARDEIDRAHGLILCDPAGRFGLTVPAGKPTVRVRTKSDVPGDTPATDAISVCALDGWNLPTLRRAIADAASASRGSATWILPRHRRALDAAADALGAARRALGPADAHALAAPELVARELRETVSALGELVGRISPDDILGRVFATFCVGK